MFLTDLIPEGIPNLLQEMAVEQLLLKDSFLFIPALSTGVSEYVIMLRKYDSTQPEATEEWERLWARAQGTLKNRKL